jgi:hypothetical protein
MAKWVLDVREDVCLAHGKDIQATELLKVMRTYGEVTPFETAIASHIAPLQKTIDNLVKQNEAVAEKQLDEFDMSIVRAAREAKQKVVMEKDNQISELLKEHNKVLEFNEQQRKDLTAFVTAFTEKYIDR